MNEDTPLAEYDGNGHYNPVTVTTNLDNTVGAIGLTVVAAFLCVTIMRLVRLNLALNERVNQLEKAEQIDQ